MAQNYDIKNRLWWEMVEINLRIFSGRKKLPYCFLDDGGENENEKVDISLFRRGKFTCPMYDYDDDDDDDEDQDGK